MACDVASECITVLKNHAHPPEHIVDNLLHFLTPACVTRCRKLVEKASTSRGKRSFEIEQLKEKLKALKQSHAESGQAETKATRSRKSKKNKGKSKLPKQASKLKDSVDVISAKLQNLARYQLEEEEDEYISFYVFKPSLVPRLVSRRIMSSLV